MKHAQKQKQTATVATSEQSRTKVIDSNHEAEDLFSEFYENVRYMINKNMAFLSKNK